MTAEISPFLSREDLARRYGVTTRTVAAWVQAGRLPKPLRAGPYRQSRVRWLREQIEATDRRVFREHGAQAVHA